MLRLINQFPGVQLNDTRRVEHLSIRFPLLNEGIDLIFGSRFKHKPA